LEKKYLTGADPVFISGSTSGCLLLHGAGGGTAWDLKEFANELHSKTGWTIWLPSLSGFGTRPEDLIGITFNDWQTDAQIGLKKLQQECNKLFVVGHSMGGLLTLILAAQYQQINGIVTWAAPVSAKSRTLTFFPFITKIPISRKAILGKYYFSPSEELKKQGWVGYDWIPTSIGINFIEGIKTLKKSLPKVKCPALIIQGTKDEMVSSKCPYIIYKTINSTKKDLWLVEGADHPIMNNEECKTELFLRTITFLKSL